MAHGSSIRFGLKALHFAARHRKAVAAGIAIVAGLAGKGAMEVAKNLRR
jgi:hypothetical protein